MPLLIDIYTHKIIIKLSGFRLIFNLSTSHIDQLHKLNNKKDENTINIIVSNWHWDLRSFFNKQTSGRDKYIFWEIEQ